MCTVLLCTPSVMLYILGAVSCWGCNSYLSRNCKVRATNLWENWFTLE